MNNKETVYTFLEVCIMLMLTAHYCYVWLGREDMGILPFKRLLQEPVEVCGHKFIYREMVCNNEVITSEYSV